MQATEPSAMPALAIRELRKVYPKGTVALKGIDLEVAAGDFFALLGPNGAGKSTTIGIAASLVTKTSGTVRIFGIDLDQDREGAKSCVGLVPQEVNFSMFETPWQIVTNQAGYYGVPRKLAGERAEQHLTRLGLWEKRHQASRTLSGGMKRRLLIARALAHEPRLLILDEPTAGVDIELRRSTWEFLQEVNARGTTIILTTHYLEEAESLCRNIAIINEGRIIEHTAMRELLARLTHETLILDIASPLESVPEIPGVKLLLQDPLTLELQFERGPSLTRAFADLASCGIEIRSLRNKSNRLEQLFVQLVDGSRSAI
jgi:ABC-2 type transport system ATP-binding protein